MNTFSDYATALAFAQKRAREWRIPQGIESRRDYGVGPVVWVVRPIPAPGKRYGPDVRCQPVEVSDVSSSAT